MPRVPRSFHNEHYFLHHYSKRELPTYLKKTLAVPQMGLLPKGFWFYKNSEWIDWCSENNCLDESTNYCYRIAVDFSNILVIDTFEKLNDFCDRFSRKDNSIDWYFVQKFYKGVYFDNYQQIRHKIKELDVNSMIWYNAIDVCSGCIFNTSTVLLHRLVF